MNIDRDVAQLRRMTVTELRQKYIEVTGDPTNSGNKEWLVRRIAWQMQAKVFGGLSDRAYRRAHELAQGVELRRTAPRNFKFQKSESDPNTFTQQLVVHDDRLPLPGALLTREYRGRQIRVRVLPKGFEHEGQVFRSLSAIAQAVTGSHWNGWLFFGLKPPKQESRR